MTNPDIQLAQSRLNLASQRFSIAQAENKLNQYSSKRALYAARMKSARAEYIRKMDALTALTCSAQEYDEEFI